MMCDFAEELGGKLYVHGGGWDRIVKREPFLNVFVAGKVLVPWDRTNERHPLTLILKDPDGSPVLAGDQGQEIAVHGQLEVGRPPGVPRGADISVPLVMRFQGLDVPPGRYRWELSVADEVVARATFDVVTG